MFDIEALDIPTAKWEKDGKQGFWFALGYGLITDNDEHSDLVMCEYKYTGQDESEGKCYDRHWDKEEHYEDDTYQEST